MRINPPANNEAIFIIHRKKPLNLRRRILHNSCRSSLQKTGGEILLKNRRIET
jgi:hypothetical protein